MAIASWRTAGGGKPRVEAALSWNLGLYPLSNANQRFSPGSRAQIVGYGSADPQEMAEYQEMRSTGYSMLGHASGPNPKSATEHGSSPQKQNGTHTCKASDLKQAEYLGEAQPNDNHRCIPGRAGRPQLSHTTPNRTLPTIAIKSFHPCRARIPVHGFSAQHAESCSIQAIACITVEL